MLPQDSPAHSIGATFTTHAQNVHTLPRPSQARLLTSPLPAANSQQPPIQSPTNFGWNPPSDIHPTAHQHNPVHTTNSLDSSSVLSGQVVPPEAVWSTVGDSAPGPSDFARIQDVQHQWNQTHVQPDHETYQQQQEQFHRLSESSAPLDSSRRASVKKKAARVPSSFVERQEKLKVSKRKGPLQEKQREKTHTMRKTKRICVRCRFYKSGVCVIFILQIPKSNSGSVTKVTPVRNVKKSLGMLGRSGSLATESI